MTPLLHELSGPPRSVSDTADILERHIGDGADPSRCEEVIEVLKRLRRTNPSYPVRVTFKLLDDSTPPCQRVRKIIDTLRNWRYFSGA